MMALGENVDCVDLAHLQRFHKYPRIELGPYSVTFEGGVKIQVDLAKAVIGFLHRILLPEKFIVLQSLYSKTR